MLFKMKKKKQKLLDREIIHTPKEMIALVLLGVVFGSLIFVSVYGYRDSKLELIPKDSIQYQEVCEEIIKEEFTPTGKMYCEKGDCMFEGKMITKTEQSCEQVKEVCEEVCEEQDILEEKIEICKKVARGNQEKYNICIEELPIYQIPDCKPVCTLKYEK